MHGQPKPSMLLELATTARASLVTLLVVILATVAAAGCLTTGVQWWRVGNCVVMYDNRDGTRQIIAAGQQCDIRREELPNVHGTAR
jgi:hypothetical protein